MFFPPCEPCLAPAHNLDAPLGQPSSLPLSRSGLCKRREGKEKNKDTYRFSPDTGHTVEPRPLWHLEPITRPPQGAAV
ncbi:unnamed protein product [Arctogadus glacialis]